MDFIPANQQQEGKGGGVREVGGAIVSVTALVMCVQTGNLRAELLEKFIWLVSYNNPPPASLAFALRGPKIWIVIRNHATLLVRDGQK